MKMNEGPADGEEQASVCEGGGGCLYVCLCLCVFIYLNLNHLCGGHVIMCTYPHRSTWNHLCFPNSAPALCNVSLPVRVGLVF